MSQDHVANVLVVDDEPAMCEMLTDALARSGMKVLSAGSGKAALELAQREDVDFLVTDLRLGDCTGLDVIDSLHDRDIDIPTVVITGYGDGKSLSEASRRRPVELMTKPINLERLTRTIQAELGKVATSRRLKGRVRRLRRLARRINLERKTIHRHLSTTCADLTTAYRTLSDQLSQQNEIIAFQNELVAASSDDDVFRALFRMFVQYSGGLFGVAMVCNQDARLRIAGRFGVPHPDSLGFCEKLTAPIVDILLTRPECLRLDATDEAERFDESIRKRLIGVNVMAVPLALNEHELIGVVVLYRKGEQPFTDSDLSLAQMIALPTAVAVRRND
jgi:DNA-binding response OmpR family regulator